MDQIWTIYISIFTYNSEQRYIYSKQQFKGCDSFSITKINQRKNQQSAKKGHYVLHCTVDARAPNYLQISVIIMIDLLIYEQDYMKLLKFF